MNKKTTHLEMIQAVVNRMSVNSFLLKGWSVVLVSALFALAATGTNPFFVYLAYFPAIAFWILDGYYLHQERLFRALYDQVRSLQEEAVDFSMDTSKLTGEKTSWPAACWSVTLLIFHGVVVGSIVIVMVLMG